MKITYIISEIDKAVYFENTAIALRSEGYEVSFVLINCENGALDTFLKEQGFNLVNIECKNIRNSWHAIKECKHFLKKQEATVIHCHLATANWVGLWAGKLSGTKKRIYTRHSGAPIKTNWKEKFIDKIQNYLATDIVAITKMIDELLKNQGVSSKKRILIHHGFDLSAFQQIEKSEIYRVKQTYNPNDQYPIIGVVARWMEWKGIQYTIESFKELLKDYPNALLCLFGGNSTGDYAENIEFQLSEIPSENYRCVPYEQNVFAIYSLFDVYVHVPINENCEAFGQTYVEALAADVPSVFTLSGIAQEFIKDKYNALAVPFEDANAITASIKKLLTDTELSQTISKNGKESVQQFSFDAYITALKLLYV